FLFSPHLHLRPLPSFPTRRSSDLSSTLRHAEIARGRSRRRSSWISAERAHNPAPRSLLGAATAPSSSVTTTSSQAASLPASAKRSGEHTSELQSLRHLVCRLLLEK